MNTEARISLIKQAAILRNSRKTYREIGQALGVTAATARTYVHIGNNEEQKAVTKTKAPDAEAPDLLEIEDHFKKILGYSLSMIPQNFEMLAGALNALEGRLTKLDALEERLANLEQKLSKEP